MLCDMVEQALGVEVGDALTESVEQADEEAD